jgi:hypothetical protein
MTGSAPSVGDSIQSKCTKCRRQTRHLVVSVVEEAAARVACTVCDGVHNYRPCGAEAPSPRRTVGVAAGKARRSAASAALEQDWEARVAAKNPKDAVLYKAFGVRLRAGALLDHQTFGLGLVRKVIPPNKIEVLFRDAIRRLVATP